MNWWLTITHRWFVFALAVMLLGSPIPPPSLATAPQVLNARIDDRAKNAAPQRPAKPGIMEPPAPVAAASEADPPNWAELQQVAPPTDGDDGSGERGSTKAIANTYAGSGVRVLISIPQQKLYAFRDGKLFGTSPVSTGKPGHRTPTGTFPILQKKVHHHSNLYSNAPMPYMQRLTHGGVAIHAGALPGYPASHGCIRLPRSFAKKLYGITSHGTRVTVTSQRPKSTEHALRLS